MDKELYNANALANRAVESQERAELERKVADQSSDEYRAALIKSKEAHDLAMQTIHDLKTTDAHKELNVMKKKLSDERDKQYDLSIQLKQIKEQLDDASQIKDQHIKQLEKGKRFVAAQSARLDERTKQLDDVKIELGTVRARLSYIEKVYDEVQIKYDEMLVDKVEKTTAAKVQYFQELVDIEKHKNQMLINDRMKLQNFFEFQKPLHSPDLPLPLYLHVDDMRMLERSQSNAFEIEHKQSIVAAFWRIQNDTLIKVGKEIADKAFEI